MTLVEFIYYILEDYLIFRILDHAYNLCDNIERHYSKLYNGTNNLNIDQVTKLSDTCYFMPSTNTKASVYTIYIQIDLCNCYVGYTGAFCKHQAFLYKF